MTIEELHKENLDKRSKKALLLFVSMALTANKTYSQHISHCNHDEKESFIKLINANNDFCSRIKNNLSKESMKSVHNMEAYWQTFIAELLKDDVN
jgi:hypothetical protein